MSNELKSKVKQLQEELKDAENELKTAREASEDLWGRNLRSQIQSNFAQVFKKYKDTDEDLEDIVQFMLDGIREIAKEVLPYYQKGKG